MKSKFTLLFAVLIAALLASCGGGGTNSNTQVTVPITVSTY